MVLRHGLDDDRLAQAAAGTPWHQPVSSPDESSATQEAGEDAALEDLLDIHAAQGHEDSPEQVLMHPAFSSLLCWRGAGLTGVLLVHVHSSGVCQKPGALSGLDAAWGIVRRGCSMPQTLTIYARSWRMLQELECYQGMRALPPALEAPVAAPVAGWVLALSILLAARLGRAASEERAYATADQQVLLHHSQASCHPLGTPLSRTWEPVAPFGRPQSHASPLCWSLPVSSPLLLAARQQSCKHGYSPGVGTVLLI